MKTKTSLTRNSISWSPLRNGFLLIVLILAWFALSPQTRAICRHGCDMNLVSNTFLGDDALLNNTTGFANTAVGADALFNNTVGTGNTATGGSALYSNTIGDFNTATGDVALFSNTTGNNNTAIGYLALASNTTGINNTATGVQALDSNTAGTQNTACGVLALAANTTGSDNTAIGLLALDSNTTGNSNTAIGLDALQNNTTGNSNIALGDSSGVNLTTGNNNIDIGNGGVGDESATIRIGTEQRTTYIAGIREAPLAQGVAIAVGITADGQLGVRASSVRFKDSVKPMDKASEAIFSLQPVTFRYKNDPAALPQFGLVAEEVAKINPDLVAPDVEGKPFTVRYDEINAMLLNEFLKEHKKGQEQDRMIAKQGAMIAEQQNQIETLTAMVKEQAAQIQKVSAQLEVNKTASQIVLNNQ